jgi:hypothetical protein
MPRRNLSLRILFVLWPGGPPPLEVGEAMIVGGSHHQMIGRRPSQSMVSTDRSSN